MKTTVKIVLSLCFLLIGMQSNAQRKQKLADKDTKQWHYDIECLGTGKQGYKLIKVWSYSKKPKYAITQSWKNAVHGIIFKGFSGTGRTCTGLRPLMNKQMAQEEYDSFFKDFFLDSGDYSQYVTDAADGLIDPRDVLKVGKKMYKIGVVVNVNVAHLRKRLEQEGIINSLATGF
jgi:hypothetical protein